MKTELQTALIDAGVESLSFTVNKVSHAVRVDEIADSGIIAILAYGARRKVNDTVNSARKSEGDKFDETATIESTLERIKAGTIATRQGVDELTKELRVLVSARLKSIGWKSEPIRKAVKDPAVGFRAFLVEYIAKAKALKPEDIDSETVDSALEKNWPAMVEKAQAAIDARAVKLDIDL